jgi:hypothetical protein
VRFKHFFTNQQERGQIATTSVAVDPGYQPSRPQQGTVGRLRRRIPPAGDPCRYVFVQKARCPRCGQPAIRKYRTNPPETDGSRTSYAMCVRDGCGWTGFLIEE